MSEAVIGKLAKALRGEGVYSAWVGINDPQVAEALAREDFDAVTLDMQHGSIDLVGAARSILSVALAGKPSVVRVGVGDFAAASRVADAGAAAVIAPMINSGAEARAFAEQMKFPPLGRRSWGPRACLPLSGFVGPAYLHEANAITLAIAMIETREALAAVDEICATPGIDGVFVGPSDLSIALANGGTVDPHGREVEEALTRVVAAAQAAGKFVGAVLLHRRAGEGGAGAGDQVHLDLHGRAAAARGGAGGVGEGAGVSARAVFVGLPRRRRALCRRARRALLRSAPAALLPQRRTSVARLSRTSPAPKSCILTTEDGERLLAWRIAPAPGCPVIVYLAWQRGRDRSSRPALRDLRRRRLRCAGGRISRLRRFDGKPERTRADARRGGRLPGGARRRAAAAHRACSASRWAQGSLSSSRRDFPVGAVALDSPYTSIADVAAARFPMFPVRALMRDRFDSEAVDRQGDGAAADRARNGRRGCAVSLRPAPVRSGAGREGVHHGRRRRASRDGLAAGRDGAVDGPARGDARRPRRLALCRDVST